MTASSPLLIAMHPSDNVAIVANDGGLAAGTLLPDNGPGAGLVLRDKVPQGHKVALQDVAEGAPVRRYNVVIGHAARAVPAGSWVHERLLHMPDACGLDDLPKATALAPDWAPLSGYTFEG